jgi:hypothetical protein
VVVALIATAVVAMVVVNRGDDGEATTHADLDLSELEPALLTEADIGYHFVRGTEAATGGGDDGSILDVAEVSADCRESIERFESLEPDTSDGSGTVRDSISATFERDHGEFSVVHSLSLTEADDPTAADVTEAWSHCDQIAYQQDGAQIEERLDLEEVDGLGDEADSVATATDVTLADGTQVSSESYSLYVTREGVFSEVGVSGPYDHDTPKSGPVDVDDLARRLADAADDKLRRALDG